MVARLAANAWDAETAERAGQVQVPRQPHIRNEGAQSFVYLCVGGLADGLDDHLDARFKPSGFPASQTSPGSGR